MKILGGEWWFIDGTAVYADGDIGDMNHTGYVLAYLYSEFVEALRSCCVPWLEELGEQMDEEFSDSITIRCEILDHVDAKCKRNGGDLPPDVEDDPWPFVAKAIEWDRDKLDALLDVGNADQRLWAVKNQGWVRCAGNNIEAWTLNDSTIKRIASAIYDACVEISPNAKFTIEERSTDTVYDDVPLYVLDEGKRSKLRDYLR